MQHSSDSKGCASKTTLSASNSLPSVDPVCGMTVTDPNKPHTEHDGVVYYFCCQGCLNRFVAAPNDYIKSESTASETTNSCCNEAKAAQQQKKQNSCGDSAAAVQVAQPSSCCGNQKTVQETAISETPISETLVKSCCGNTAAVPIVPTSSCCGSPTVAHANVDHAIDPVCGMQVDKSSPLQTQYQDATYYFCHQGCLDKFKADPDFYLLPVEQRPVPEGAADMDYTCPMDPEIVQKGPGTCPICGMALEPMQPTLDDGPNPELVDFSNRFWKTLPLSLLVMVLAMGSHVHAMIPMHIQPWIELALSIPVVFWAGWPILQRCVSSYRTMHLNMWSLIGVGVIAAFAYSLFATIFPEWIPSAAKTGHGAAVYYEAACMIVSLSLLGQILELKARAKTADALKALLRLQPNIAHHRTAGGIEEVKVEDLHIDDQILIGSGEQVPIDGIVIDGQSYIDESMLTGESAAVKKQVDDHVIGGTVNQHGSLTVRVTKTAQQTTLAGMIQAVADAQRSKAPLQKIADRVAKYFVVAVLAISLLTFLMWKFVAGSDVDLALMCAVAVLIIACPCALGLATPMSVMAATGRAAQQGVLFKDAEAIESLSQVDTLIIDKTGTVTEGQPSVQGVQLFVHEDINGKDQTYYQTILRSLEQHSSHPIAQSIVKHYADLPLLQVNDFAELGGLGIGGVVDGVQYVVGSEKLVQQQGLQLSQDQQHQAEQARHLGQSISYLMNEHQVLGMVAIQDAIKANAKDVIQALQAKGISVIMASGDHRDNVRAVAEQLGISRYYGNLLPEEKLALVEQLQQQGQHVAMAGDGVNDAPALAKAHVGIAMGNGTDIAKTTAAVTLVKGDMHSILSAFAYAKAGVRNMQQNLAFSMFYNGLGVPLAAGILYPFTGWLLTPMFAAVAMSLSSLSVILNALRLSKGKAEL